MGGGEVANPPAGVEVLVAAIEGGAQGAEAAQVVAPVQRSPGDEGDSLLLEAALAQHRIEVVVVVAVAVLAQSIEEAPGTQLQVIGRRQVEGELRRVAFVVVDALEPRPAGEGIGAVVHTPGHAELAAAIVHQQSQPRVLRGHPPGTREGVLPRPVGVVAHRAPLQGRVVEVAREPVSIAVEGAPAGEEVDVAGGAGERHLAQELVVLPRIAAQAAVKPLFAAAGADLEHAADRTVAVEHRVVSVGEADVLDDLRRDLGGVELSVVGVVEGNAVEEQQHVPGAKAPQVDARDAVGAGANDRAGHAHQRLVQGPCALLGDVLPVHPPGRDHILHQVAIGGHRLLVGRARHRGDGRGRALPGIPGCGIRRSRPRGRHGQPDRTPCEPTPPPHYQPPAPPTAAHGDRYSHPNITNAERAPPRSASGGCGISPRCGGRARSFPRPGHRGPRGRGRWRGSSPSPWRESAGSAPRRAA